MDKSLQTLCEALKKILIFLKPQHNAISFLLVTGKVNQGKTAFLRQTNLIHYPVECEHSANFFYNNLGVILELGETWLGKSENLLTYTLKQLNRCHPNVRISGIILCIAANELLSTEPLALIDHCKAHTQLLKRFSNGLSYEVDLAIILSKLDTVAGFCDFFQPDQEKNLTQPLGFSVDASRQKSTLIANVRKQFDQMIEALGQQIINKLHPARSSVKRTLIRELPLQLASLIIPLQVLIQHLPSRFLLRAIYFISAEQGGISIDKLNKKIQHEYALTIQDKFPQANNYRPYFIEGAIRAFQEQTKRYLPQISLWQKSVIGLSSLLLVFSFSYLTQHHFKTSSLLDEASKELLIYEALLNKPSDKTAALYHLSQAAAKIQTIPANFLSATAVEKLRILLSKNTRYRLHDKFLPDLLLSLETQLNNPAESVVSRYEALKIYLMLGDANHYSEQEVIDWFKKFWQKKYSESELHRQLALLKATLKQPLQPIEINKQLLSDVRNYLNALPATYLYYSLAKNNFPHSSTPINAEGFQLANKELPLAYTKEGFKQIITNLATIAGQLQQENWVLARQDLSGLQAQLEQAYCFEYLTWWQNFIKRTKPLHFQNYQEAAQLAKKLATNRGLLDLIKLIQEHTSPEASDNLILFNQQIAYEFSSLNLLSKSAAKELHQTINELEKYLTTLSLVKDQGRTAFELTKTRFNGGILSDPLSNLYHKARQLPPPIADWAKQIADDSWFIFIKESKAYLNKQWNKLIYKEYIKYIANRYPFDPRQKEEVAIKDFDHFFSPHGSFNRFMDTYLKPFLDRSIPQWQPKEVNGYVMPISSDITHELIRANVITNMFFPSPSEATKVEFSLQKINLDPIVANFKLTLGNSDITDSQNSNSYVQFSWPQENAKLSLDSIEGNHYEIEETGPWALFKLLQKVNVLVDSEDSANLQILFEINGNSGRYLLKTQNQINPFSPGILTGFTLTKTLA